MGDADIRPRIRHANGRRYGLMSVRETKNVRRADGGVVVEGREGP